MHAIKYYHIVIAGFTQKFGLQGNGIDRLDHELHKLYGGQDTRNWYLPWYCDVTGYAESIFNYGKDAKIQIAGYSFGGQTAVNLCRELAVRGVSVDRLCLIDAVKRRSRFPWGWLSAFNRLTKIRVPDNVKGVSIFTQSNGWPRGHRVVFNNPTVSVSINEDMRNVTHIHMDHSRVVWDQVLQDAKHIRGIDE